MGDGASRAGDVGEQAGVVFYVMELIEGESLHDLARRRGRLVAVMEKGPANCNIWAEPKLIAKDGSVAKLTDLKGPREGRWA